MNRTTVQLAVLAALGVITTDARGGIPEGLIPELENATAEETPGTVPNTEDEKLSVAQIVEKRWKRVHRAHFAAGDAANSAGVAAVEAALHQIPKAVGSPIEAEQRIWSGMVDLSTTEGRVDSVLHCVATGRTLQMCDLNGVSSADEARKKAGVTGQAGLPDQAWLDEALVWHGLGGQCAQPILTGGCGYGITVDAKSGVCYQEHPCRRGRPFADGRVAELVGETRTAAGDAWAQVALDEHASVASFACHVLELMAVGAPSELLTAASQAQLDEVRHAELALGLARSFGAEVELGAMDTTSAPRRTLVEVLLSVAEHGCIGETVSAVECAIALEQTDDPRVREVLEVIVSDEAAHAALAWRTLAWGLPRLPPEERATVLAVFASVTVGPAPEAPAGIGVLGGLEAEQARRWALAQVVAPALEALAS